MARTEAEQRAIEIEQELTALRSQQTGIPSQAENVKAREINVKKGQLRLAQLEAEFGAPRIAGSEGQLREFQTQDMTRRTFSESGVLTSFELSPFYQNDYSPYDQRKIEKLYETRSKVALNPDLTEDERQSFFDKIDADVSNVPRLNPMMRQPTPQETFEQSIVTDPVTNTRGFFDPKSGTFNPINANQNQEHQKLWWSRYDKNTTALRAANNRPLVLPKDRLSEEQIQQRARQMTDVEVGSLGMTETAGTPQADELSRLYGLKRGEGTVTVDGKTAKVSGGKVTDISQNLADMMQRFGQGAGLDTGEFAPGQMIKVISPNGDIGYIPQEDMDEALATGYRLAG